MRASKRLAGCVNAPEGHVGTRDGGQADGARETLVTLGVVVLQTDLKLDGLEEVSLLLILRVVEQLLNVLAHSGCSHKFFTLADSSGIEIDRRYLSNTV